VPRIPHISNFTDIEALSHEPEVEVIWTATPARINAADAVILPGSKNVIADMAFLRKHNWQIALDQYAVSGKGLVIGLCGGFQMLGKEIFDPDAVEGHRRECAGLGLLDVVTRLDTKKVVQRSDGTENLFHTPVSGYEIHMGKTERGADAQPFVRLENETDGAISESGNVFGTYLHGLFDSGAFRKKFLEYVSEKKGMALNPDIERPDFWRVKEENYDRLADHFERYTRVDEILQVMGLDT